MLPRDSNDVLIAPSCHVHSEDIAKRAMKNIEDGATIYHDDYRPYGALDGLYRHESVNHSGGEYAREGGIHINTAEAEFSIFEPWLETYRGVSKENLYLYCAQYQFLTRTRDFDRAYRATIILFSTFSHSRREKNINKKI